jgi:YD repeat-containing protein
MGHTTDYEFHSLNRRVVMRFPAAEQSQDRSTQLTAYDEAGNLMTQTDANNQPAVTIRSHGEKKR